MRSLSLTRNSAAPRTSIVSPSGSRAPSAAKAGISSITPGTSAGAMLKLRNVDEAMRSVPTGSALTSASTVALTSAPARRRISEQRQPAPVEADPGDLDAAAAGSRRQDRPESGSGQVTRDVHGAGAQLLSAFHRDRAPVDIHVDTERRQGPLRMIACGCGLRRPSSGRAPGCRRGGRRS